MPTASDASSLHNLTLKIGELPTMARIAITLSDQLPDARFVVNGPGAAMRITAQPPNLSFSLVNFRFQPQRVELEFASMPPNLLFEFTIQCDEPFLVGSLEVPEDAHSSFVTPIATVRSFGGGYWAVPLRKPGQQHPTHPGTKTAPTGGSPRKTE